MTIRRRLAVGGMAELFLADRVHAKGPPERVVVKRALPGADASFLELLGREREALAQIQSPHVVKLLGGADDWLLLEYVDGSDFGTLIDHHTKRGRVLPLEAALCGIVGLLSGLSDLHAATDSAGRPLGLVHRDVNPSNVLIGRDGSVKLADLGVVHLSFAEQPTIGGLKGTLAYMAPEQLLGQSLDRRTDLYAAALVAYEALTGVAARPTGMVGVAELLQARQSLPAAPSSVRAQLPAALDAVILAALAPDRAGRPSDANEWRSALLDAADCAPSQEALARATSGAERPVASVVRTATPGLRPSVRTPAAIDEGPGESAALPPRRGLGWSGVAVLGALSAVLGLLLSDFFAEEGAQRAGPKPPPRSGEVAPGPVQVSARTTATALRRGRTGLVELPVPALRPPESSQALARRRLTTRYRKPKGPRESAADAAHLQLSISSVGGGSLYVSGAGAKGLTPPARKTHNLADGAHLISLRGAGGARATLRVVRRANRLVATVGAPTGSFWTTVTCGGVKRGPTPVRGLAIGGRLTCRLEREGARLAFALSRVRP